MTYSTIMLAIEPIAPGSEMDPLGDMSAADADASVDAALAASGKSEATACMAFVIFNRPEVRNALNQTMVDELRDALSVLHEIDGLRGVIFAGAGGKAFLGGADIAELKSRGSLDALRRINSSLFREVEQFPVPTIAAITGFALGGGCEIALACDMRICGESAKLGQPEVGLGILPGAGATYRLPRVVGGAIARELIFTGRILDAAEAQRIGLVNHVIADAAVLDRARALTREIAANSALAVRFAKIAINSTTGMGTDMAMALESTAQAVLFDDPEKHDRMGAFVARRDARRKERQNA